MTHKPRHRNIIYIFSLTFLFLSCQKSEYEPPPISHTDMYSCYRQFEWDEIDIRNSLLGRWEWEFVAGPSGRGKYVSAEELYMEFREDSTLIVTQRDTIIQHCTWYIVGGDADLFAIEVEPPVDQLGGRILLCDNRVAFNNSYIDLSDNYFQRKH